MRLSPLYPLPLFFLAFACFGQDQTRPFATSGIFVEGRGTSIGTPTPPPESSQPDAPAVTPPSAAVPTSASPPMTVGQKFVRSTKTIFGPVGLLAVAASAGYEQLTNTPGEWGQGGKAYAERVGSAFGISFVDGYSEFAIAAAVHEDPRYYPSTDPSFKARFKSACKQTFVKKTDSGGHTFAYAEFGGALAAGFSSNAWLPRSDNSAGDALETAAVLIGRDFGFNLVREFVPLFRHIQ